MNYERLAKGYKEVLSWDQAEMFSCICGRRWFHGINSPDLDGIQTVDENFEDAKRYKTIDKDEFTTSMIHVCDCGKPILVAFWEGEPGGEWETYEFHNIHKVKFVEKVVNKEVVKIRIK